MSMFSGTAGDLAESQDESQDSREVLVEKLAVAEGARDSYHALAESRWDLYTGAIDERNAVQRELDRFREQVRDVAISVKKEMGWCLPGLNERLNELGLEPYAERWQVPVEVTYYVTVDDDGTGSYGASRNAETLVRELSRYTEASIVEFEIDTDEIEPVGS